jgi:hypothetical protein
MINRFTNRTTVTILLHAQTHNNPFGRGTSVHNTTPPSTEIRNAQTTHNPSGRVLATATVYTTVRTNRNSFGKGPCRRLRHWRDNMMLLPGAARTSIQDDIEPRTTEIRIAVAQTFHDPCGRGLFAKHQDVSHINHLQHVKRRI